MNINEPDLISIASDQFSQRSTAKNTLITIQPDASRIIAHYSDTFDLFLVDQLKFRTRLRISRAALAAPSTFAGNSNTRPRSVQPKKNHWSHGGVAGFQKKLLSYGGVIMNVSAPGADGLCCVDVTINPCKILYGHNGRVLRADEFLDALTIYASYARHLLKDPDDWFDLIPGIRDGGPAYWTYIEMFCHISDPDGKVFRLMRQLRCQKIRKRAQHWKTTIKLGGKRSKTKFCIYRKAIEMYDRKKLPHHLLSMYDDILRFEVRLKDKHLVDCLGDANSVAEMDGKKQLVKFSPNRILRAIRSLFYHLENVWHSDQPTAKSKQLAMLATLITKIADDRRESKTFLELIDLLKTYTLTNSKSTIKKIRGAGKIEMERKSPLAPESLFSDASLRAQPSIAIHEIERKVSYYSQDIRRHPLLETAYLDPGYIPSSRPLPSYAYKNYQA
ncbi:MAG: hypothetical protein EAZ81_04055 [Verrucomicrobia bacterium]|nr:MAG: hypothetical protein EAZ81_04055 [Verrucomicrobiota bacterium]